MTPLPNLSQLSLGADAVGADGDREDEWQRRAARLKAMANASPRQMGYARPWEVEDDDLRERRAAAERELNSLTDGVIEAYREVEMLKELQRRLGGPPQPSEEELREQELREQEMRRLYARRNDGPDGPGPGPWRSRFVYQDAPDTQPAERPQPAKEPGP